MPMSDRWMTRLELALRADELARHFAQIGRLWNMLRSAAGPRGTSPQNRSLSG